MCIWLVFKVLKFHEFQGYWLMCDPQNNKQKCILFGEAICENKIVKNYIFMVNYINGMVCIVWPIAYAYPESFAVGMFLLLRIASN